MPITKQRTLLVEEKREAQGNGVPKRNPVDKTTRVNTIYAKGMDPLN